MSSQDDHQISEKRRRLFKALSAAPVVATLRPGEALANSSAYQCAENIKNGHPSLVHRGPTTVSDHFLSKPLFYIKKKNTTGYYVEVTGRFENNSWISWAEAKWFDENGDLKTPTYPSTLGNQMIVFDGEEYKNWSVDSQGDRHEGRFAILGKLNSSGSFDAKVVHPQIYNDVYGITGTCMNSFHGIPNSWGNNS